MRPQLTRRAQPDVHAELDPADHQRVAHVVARVAEVAVGDVAQVLVAGLGHRENVGQDLGGVELIGEPVPHRHPGELRQDLDVRLRGSPVLDPVKGAAEHPGGVLHGLLVADLGPARLQVGHVCALVLGGDLERGASPRRRLLEDQRYVLARQVRLLVAGILRGLEVGGQLEEEPQLLGSEVELLEEAAVAEVEWHRAVLCLGGDGGVIERASEGDRVVDRCRMTPGMVARSIMVFRWPRHRRARFAPYDASRDAAFSADAATGSVAPRPVTGASSRLAIRCLHGRLRQESRRC